MENNENKVWEIIPGTKEKIKQKLLSVLNGISDKVKLPMLPINVFTDVFKELDIIVLPEYMDKNGWQVDFWIDITFQETEYCLEGSLWHGEYEFYKND